MSPTSRKQKSAALSCTTTNESIEQECSSRAPNQEEEIRQMQNTNQANGFPVSALVC